MVCIYCGGKTEVTNSRPQKRLNQTWRRRQCLGCGGIFTSIETADFGSSLLFKSKKGHLQPFSRDKLFISIYEACKHRKSAQSDAAALTTTVMSKLLHHIQSASLQREHVIGVSTDVLQRFDKAAASYYTAYHPF